MMRFDLTVLGTAAATPSLNRNPTAQVLNINEQPYLLDCGEGTQVQLLKYEIKRTRIKTIFISHLHGDHYFGLIGLLSTFHLQKREDDLYIIAPENLKDIIEIQLKASQTTLNYQIHFISTNPDISELIWQDDHCTVHTIPLIHRVPTTGFLFKEKPQKRKINTERTSFYQIPNYFLSRLQLGEDYQRQDGTIISNAELTLDPPAPRTFAYCTDTCFAPQIVPIISNCDLLYHESTFTTEHEARAQETFHSTAAQAAQIALFANAKKLLLGHYSSKYKDINPFLIEAKTIFENSHLAEEGQVFSI